MCLDFHILAAAAAAAAQVFDYLLLHIDPVRVSLTSAFVECLYTFFFPPAAPQAVDAVALLAPTLKRPSPVAAAAPAAAAAAAAGAISAQGSGDLPPATAAAADAAAIAAAGNAVATLAEQLQQPRKPKSPLNL